LDNAKRLLAPFTIRNGTFEPHYVEPTASGLLGDAERLVWHQDEPFHSLSIFAGWNVMRLAAEANVTVLLNGQGADEYLGGYRPFDVYLCEMVGNGRLLQATSQARMIGRINSLTPTSLLRSVGRLYCASAISNWRRRLQGLVNCRDARPGLMMAVSREGIDPPLVPAREPVGVPEERGGGLRVAHLGGHVGQRRAFGQERRRERVPEVVV
jgi:hypothetical protein